VSWEVERAQVRKCELRLKQLGRDHSRKRRRLRCARKNGDDETPGTKRPCLRVSTNLTTTDEVTRHGIHDKRVRRDLRERPCKEQDGLHWLGGRPSSGIYRDPANAVRICEAKSLPIYLVLMARGFSSHRRLARGRTMTLDGAAGPPAGSQLCEVC
jgi:hypothetical protein